MDLMQMLQGHLNDDVMNQIGGQIGAEPQQTAAAASGIFASLLGGMAQNAATPGGLQSLMGALDSDHDGSVLDDLMGMVSGNASTGSPSALNGAGILGHILGGQKEQVAQQVSQSSGLDMGQVMKLMPILAPILMGVLGKAKSGGQLGLGNLASILFGSAQNAGQQSGMGDLLGSVLGGVFGGGQRQQQASPDGGDLLGNILGGVLGGQQQPQQQQQSPDGGGLFGKILGGVFGKN